MIIGIDCSRYYKATPTGVELYTNHITNGIIEHANKFKTHKIILYTQNQIQTNKLKEKNLPSNFKVKLIRPTRLWTLIGLTKEMLFKGCDLLYIPSHTFPLKMPKKSLITIHGIEAFQIPEAYTKRQIRQQTHHAKRAAKHATKIIAVSQTVKNNLIKYTNCDTQKMKIIYNGFTTPGKNNKEILIKRHREILFNKNGTQKIKYIFSLGRLEKRKNQLRLIQAFEKIADIFPELHLILGGTILQKESQQIIQQMEKSLYKERIKRLGHVKPDSVSILMRHAELFAFPSLSEGFGIPILEAMNAGTPVLTSKDSGCDEIASDAAIHINPYSIDDIAKGITKLLTDKKLCQTLTRKGKLRALQFSWKKCTDETINTLLSLVE
jgi:glycosyltransferase involved in cell wall biosynthesis